MKILVSAYACEPGKGSEPEVGLQVLLAAASRHEVWVITRENNLEPLRRILAGTELGPRVHLEGVDLSPRARWIKKRGIVGLHWYYDRWQRAVARRGAALDRSVAFDVVHHATFATYWARAGVLDIGRPSVWGPVGGGAETPFALLPVLGWRGVPGDLLRAGGRRLLRHAPACRAARRQARVVFVQNPETGRRLGTDADVVVLPNATAVEVPSLPSAAERTARVLFVGNLTPLKAPILAVRAFAQVRHPGATMEIYGEGPERRRVERAMADLGVSHRVTLAGAVPRAVVLKRVATAGALLHPALHDEAGLSVAEALAYGTPVVCLDHGGPAQVARHWPSTSWRAVPPTRPRATVSALAGALDAFLADPAPVPPAPHAADPSFRDLVLAAYERAAGGA